MQPGRLAPRGVVGRGVLDQGDRCNYCHELGHWKSECPVLRVKSRPGKAYVKPAAAVAPVAPVAVPEREMPSAVVGEAEVWAAYAPFISDGFVSLVGSDVK